MHLPSLTAPEYLLDQNVEKLATNAYLQTNMKQKASYIIIACGVALSWSLYLNEIAPVPIDGAVHISCTKVFRVALVWVAADCTELIVYNTIKVNHTVCI